MSPRRRIVREELALDVGQRRGQWRAGRARELLHRAARERGQILDRPLERGERRAGGLVRDRDRDLGARGERLDQRPLRRGQVLEAVGEDRLAVPGAEIALESLRRPAAHAVAVPEPEPVELLPIRPREPSELAADAIRVEQRGLELAERTEEHVGKAAGPGGDPKIVERRLGDRAPDRERALRVGRDRAAVRIARRDLLEEIVEGPDAAAEQRAAASEEIPFDPLHVAAGGDDEPRIAVERGEIALEEQRNLAGMRRPDDEREPHPRMVVPPSGAPSYADEALSANSALSLAGGALRGPGYAAADFGRRPRRATCWPGMSPAQPSHRSACFDLVRASV